MPRDEGPCTVNAACVTSSCGTANSTDISIMPFTPDPQPVASASQRSLIVIATGVVLALLYFGKDVLVPIILAMILALLMAPFVRLLQKMRLGHTYAVVIAALLLATVATGLMTVIGSQIVHLAESLPQYEKTVQANLQVLRAL